MSVPNDVISGESVHLQPNSRRRLLTGVVGGVAAWIASGLGRAAPTRAADGEAVHVGGEYFGSTVTKVTINTQGNTALGGESSTGVGVHGKSTSSTGVFGETGSWAGVLGTGVSGTGVEGPQRLWRRRHWQQQL